MLPLRAEGRSLVRAPPDAVRAAILDPARLARIIPGAERLSRTADGAFVATLGLGVGPFRGRQVVTLRIDEETAEGLAVSGQAAGPFGTGKAVGRIALRPQGEGTLLAWGYEGVVRGPVTLAGPRLLRLAATAFTQRVFSALARQIRLPDPPVRHDREAGPGVATGAGSQLRPG